MYEDSREKYNSGKSVMKLKSGVETCAGDAGHHEGHLRHDGKMHVPRPEGGDAPSARGGLLPGRCRGTVPSSGEAADQRLYLSCVLSPTEDGQEQRRRGDH